MTAHPEQLHADVVAAIKAWLRQRDIDTNHGPGEWRNPAIRTRLTHIIQTVQVRTHRIGVITATTEDGSDGDGVTWHYIARDALAAAADRMNLRDYRIEPGDTVRTYRLTWH